LFYGDALHLTSDGFAIVGRYIATQLEAPLTLQATSDMSLDVAHQFGRTLTSRMDSGAPRDGDTAEGLKFFVVGDGYSRHLNAGPRNDAYRSSGVGATAGVEYGFGTAMVGAALNYSKPKANFSNDAAETESKSLQVGGYGPLRSPEVSPSLCRLRRDEHDIDRAGVVTGWRPTRRRPHPGARRLPVPAGRSGSAGGRLDYAKAKVDGYRDGDRHDAQRRFPVLQVFARHHSA
jgi:hypothetical protein